MKQYLFNDELTSLQKIKGKLYSPLLQAWFAFSMKNNYRCIKNDPRVEVTLIPRPGYRIFMIRPKDLQGENNPFLIDFHGGGFVFRGWDNHFYWAMKYALKCHCIVFYVDYSLAYKGKYGKTLADCKDAIFYLRDHALDYRLDSKRMVLVGDSAGAYLALQCHQSLRNADVPSAGLLLIYPVVDPLMRGKSHQEFINTPVWNSVANKKMWQYYCKGRKEVSPLDVSLFHMENTYIEVCQYDCLRDDGLLLYDKIKDCHHVLLEDVKGSFHGYDIDLSWEICRNILKKRSEFISSCFEKVDETTAPMNDS